MLKNEVLNKVDWIPWNRYPKEAIALSYLNKILAIIHIVDIFKPSSCYGYICSFIFKGFFMNKKSFIFISNSV